MRQAVLPGLDPFAGVDGGLVVRGPSDRFARLLEDNRRLLRRVAQKQRALGRLHDELRVQATRAADLLGPLTERLEALDEEIHLLFGELLEGGKKSRRGRREVRELYDLLQAEGVISPKGDAGEGWWGGDEHGDEQPGPEPVDELPSAVRPRDDQTGGTVREIFLRLAHALHPDRAAAGEDGEARTEAMKDVNRAYQDGDLARLVEMERMWIRTRGVGHSKEETDRRAEDLDRTNRGLGAQLKALEREYRELKRSDAAKLAARSRAGHDRLTEMVQDGEEQVARLGQIRDHVRAYRDGKISLEALLAGPDGEDGEEDDDGVEMTIEEALAFLAGQQEPAPVRGRGKRGPRRKRQRRKR